MYSILKWQCTLWSHKIYEIEIYLPMRFKWFFPISEWEYWCTWKEQNGKIIVFGNFIPFPQLTKVNQTSAKFLTLTSFKLIGWEQNKYHSTFFAFILSCYTKTEEEEDDKQKRSTWRWFDRQPESDTKIADSEWEKTSERKKYHPKKRK